MSLDQYSAGKLLDHMVVVLLLFKENAILFSIVDAAIYIPKTVFKGSLFPIFSPTHLIC